MTSAPVASNRPRQPLAGVRTEEPSSATLRVVLICGEDHKDFDSAFAAIVAARSQVLLLCPPGFAEGRALPAGTTVQTFDWPRHRQALGNLRLVFGLARAVRAFRPDLVHVLSEGQVWLNLLPMLIRPFPLVVTVHDVRPHPGDRDTARVPRAVVELFIRQADALIVHGEGLREEAVLRLKTPRDRIHLGLHPPLNRYRDIAKAMGMVKPDDGVFRMLFFGRIFAYKGLDHLIDAEPLIGEDVTPRRVIIAGRGDDMAGYEARMRDPARFDVRARAIGDEEAASLFASADLLVLPYIEASQSGVLMIAAAFGLPVVASDVGELGALVRRTGMGLTTPPGDAGALAGRITALARDPAARAELSAAAEKALKGPLSDDAVWAHAEAAYRSALRRRRGL